jgi:hypothetical protein
MSTSNFGAIEDLGNHSDSNIPNPELSDMELDAPEELPLPRRMAVKPSNPKTVNNTVQGFFFFLFRSSAMDPLKYS